MRLRLKYIGCFLLGTLSLCWETQILAKSSQSSTQASTSRKTVLSDLKSAPPVQNSTSLSTTPPDDFEKFNRAMFSFNETLDKYIFKPIAQIYNLAMPKLLNTGIHNMFNNVGTFPTIVNDLLQANFYQASSDSWRMLFNSTLGFGGFFDVGSHVGLNMYSNDFGQTLTKWGCKKSTYIVLPFFGPSTIRDTIGLPIDYEMSMYPQIKDIALRNEIWTLEKIDKRVQLLRFENVYQTIALDRYIFIRDAYFERRSYGLMSNKEKLLNDLYIDEKDEETSPQPQISSDPIVQEKQIDNYLDE
jgi:phospholipid-binding lipoprotein MlaA